MAGRLRQPLDAGGVIDHQSKPGLRHMGQAQQAEAPHLDQPRERRAGAAMPCSISTRSSATRSKSAVEQTQHQVGLPRPEPAPQQHPGAVPGCAAPMDLHKAAMWAGAAERKRLVAFFAPCRRPTDFAGER